MEVIIEISNRHVHLTKKVYDMLFDEEMSVKKYLSQTGEFVSNQVVTLKANDVVIENVKVLGPFRDYNQVEISKKDAIKLKLNPPVRKSGDVMESEKITLVTPKAEIEIEGCIIAQRHVHMNTENAQKYNVVDGQVVQIIIDGDKSGVMDAYVKVSENGVFRAHLDTDDAACFLLENNQIGNLKI